MLVGVPRENLAVRNPFIGDRLESASLGCRQGVYVPVAAAAAAAAFVCKVVPESA